MLKKNTLFQNINILRGPPTTKVSGFSFNIGLPMSYPQQKSHWSNGGCQHRTNRYTNVRATSACSLGCLLMKVIHRWTSRKAYHWLPTVGHGWTTCKLYCWLPTVDHCLSAGHATTEPPLKVPNSGPLVGHQSTLLATEGGPPVDQ